MPDDRDNSEPLSSEELIRRAREEMAASPPPRPETEPEADEPVPLPEDDDELDALARATRRRLDEPEVEADPRLDEPAPSDLETFPDLGSDVDLPPPPQDVPPPPQDLPPPPPQEPPSSPDDPWGPPPDFPGSSGPLPAPSPARRSGFASVGRWIGGAVVAFLLFGQCFGGGTTLDDLEIGDCFEDPGDGEVSDVDKVDCSELHDYELYATVELGGPGRSYPGEDTLFTELQDECVARFSGYVGSDYFTSAYDFVGFTPVADGWRDGDRTGMCALYEFDQLRPFSVVRRAGSARNSGR